MGKVRAERTVVILMIVMINICLLVPVWQSATNSQLRFKLAQTEEQMKLQEEQKMVIVANIAKQMTPEYLIEQSETRNLVFTQIDSASSTFVASNR